MSYLILNKGIATALGRVSINTWYAIEPVELNDGTYAISKDAIDAINGLAVKDAKKVNAIRNAVRNAVEVEKIDSILIQYDDSGKPIHKLK